MLTIERLEEMNQWWRLGSVKDIFAPVHKRALFYEINKHVKLKQIIGIIGLRRVGKTTILYQIIQDLIKNKTNPKHILYFSFDEEKDEIREVIKLYEEKVLQKGLGEEEKVYVFFDEIQKTEDWQNKIKTLYDLYPNIKFFISGSASLNLLLKAKETLAGRIFYFSADLLSFREFLEFKGLLSKIEKNSNLWGSELRIQLNNYLIRPFPEIINAEEEIAKKYIKESIIEKAIFRDLTSLFEIKEAELIEKLMHILASNPGMMVNLEDLSKEMNRSRQLISNYLYYLECCFLVKSLRNFRGSLRASSRKLKKYYLIHPALSVSLEFPDSGKIAENAISFKSKADYFWRELDKEVDFVLHDKKIIRPLEVKYQKNINDKDIKSLLKFMYVFKVNDATVITQNYEQKKKVDGKTINFIPMWKYMME